MEKEKTYKRRVRYSGTHPKRYSEKYKEMQPDKYPEIIEKVISKGSTPVGMHLSICVKEILDFFDIQEGQIGLDCTLGYGGHTLEMLKCLKTGHMHAIDLDTIEMQKTKNRLKNLGYDESILKIRQLNFSNIDSFLNEGISFDFVLADLGVSSMQIDNPERGFSYKKHGPLDLRLDSKSGMPASEVLEYVSFEELKNMLIDNSDEPYAEEITKAIFSSKKKGIIIDTTTVLKKIIEERLRLLKVNKEDIKKSCQRVFQALRIKVNDEFNSLSLFLEKLPNVLKTNGKVAILAFHSGEDRLVKKAFKKGLLDGVYSDIANEVIRPSLDECSINSRARSTKMRWAIKS